MVSVGRWHSYIEASQRLRATIVTVVLSTYAVLLFVSSKGNFVTTAEIGHLGAGLSHWEVGDFQAYKVNPPMPRLLSTAVVHWLAFNRDYGRIDEKAGSRPEWTLGLKLAHANKSTYFELVQIARVPTFAWALLGAYLIYAWTRQLYDSSVALLVLICWCTEPNIFAHSQLITPDIPAAVSALACVFAFHSHLRRPTTATPLLVGLLLGIAQLTKYTLLFLYILLPIVVIIRWVWNSQFHAIRRTEAGRIGLEMLVTIFISVLVINAGYGFQEVGMRLGDFEFVSRLFGGEPADASVSYENGRFGNRFRNSCLASVPLPFPRRYVEGIDVQQRDFEYQWPSYLAGVWRHDGWWYYYLYCAAIKIPIGLLILLVWSVCLHAWMFRRSSLDAVSVTLVWLPVVLVLGMVSAKTGINSHLRYLFPVFPFAIVGIGRVIAATRWPRPLHMLVLGLIAWAGASSMTAYPRQLSYFNEVVGGPANGPKHVLDSNIDWGQDLLRLRTWVAAHPQADDMYIAYFGLLSPSFVDLSYRVPQPFVEGVSTENSEHAMSIGPVPGWHAVSVNFVYGAHFKIANDKGEFTHVPLQGYSYYQRFRPIAKAGDSIYIYFISREDANKVRADMGLPVVGGRTHWN